MTSYSSRPAVSVVVPFAGPDAELERTLAALTPLELACQDEILIADNGPTAARAVSWPAGARRVAALGLRAPGYARNRGAWQARGEWLVFLDADVRPAPGLLEAYFTPAPGARTGVLAGGIHDLAGADSPAARYSASRSQMSHLTTLARGGRPYAQTANCAVRCAAFAAVGGFSEEARYGEDADLCWRLAAAGWALEVRERALAEHVSRPTLSGLLAQLAGHGAGAAWLARRYPGEFPAVRASAVARQGAGSATRCALGLIRGQPTAAGEAAIAGLEALAFAAGRRRSNRPRRGWRR